MSRSAPKTFRQRFRRLLMSFAIRVLHPEPPEAHAQLDYGPGVCVSWPGCRWRASICPSRGRDHGLVSRDPRMGLPRSPSEPGDSGTCTTAESCGVWPGVVSLPMSRVTAVEVPESVGGGGALAGRRCSLEMAVPARSGSRWRSPLGSRSDAGASLDVLATRRRRRGGWMIPELSWNPAWATLKLRVAALGGRPLRPVSPEVTVPSTSQRLLVQPWWAPGNALMSDGRGRAGQSWPYIG